MERKLEQCQICKISSLFVHIEPDLAILFSCIFFSLISAESAIPKPSFRPKALVLPVTKDPSSLQYLTFINQRTPLVPVKLTLDLGGQFLWLDCENGYVSSSYKPARCRSAQCSLARSASCGECFAGPKPGCNNNTCGLLPDNTVTHTATSGEVATDVAAMHSTDGQTPGQIVSVPNLILVCAPTFLLQGLPSGVKGMAALGSAKIGLPSQFAAAFSFSRKFAICLSASNGVVLFGDGPYIGGSGDISRSLTYTPLIRNPVSTASAYSEGDPSTEYFIGVKSILVNNKPVPVNVSLLSINRKGQGGTKISTVDPYTVLETSIYSAVVNAFVKEMGSVPRVAAVAPFRICYGSKSIGRTRVGPAVPEIDLVLQSGGVKWSIVGANSMVEVSKDVMCLGFVDGGVRPVTSIVIGGHQIEDNLVQFDLARSRIGFTPYLAYLKTGCATFKSPAFDA